MCACVLLRAWGVLVRVECVRGEKIHRRFGVYENCVNVRSPNKLVTCALSTELIAQDISSLFSCRCGDQLRWRTSIPEGRHAQPTHEVLRLEASCCLSMEGGECSCTRPAQLLEASCSLSILQTQPRDQLQLHAGVLHALPYICLTVYRTFCAFFRSFELRR